MNTEPSYAVEFAAAFAEAYPGADVPELLAVEEDMEICAEWILRRRRASFWTYGDLQGKWMITDVRGDDVKRWRYVDDSEQGWDFAAELRKLGPLP